MRVFLAGAGGALGRRLVPLLVEQGHAVTAMTRSVGRLDALRQAGAEPVICDALDAAAVRAAVSAAEPEVVVHELTALSAMGAGRNFDKTFAATNRLRTEGTDNLLAAARAAGARRFVAQSYAGWPYAREGSAVKSEDDPLDPNPPADARKSLAAIRHLEAAVLGASDLEGIVLRYGNFYGPGTSLDRDGRHTQMVKKRQFPLVGNGTGIWSFIHVDDAAAATVAAIERGRPGVYNIVDDEPAPIAEFLPVFVSIVGARPPRRLPTWLARLAAGQQAVSMMTATRGASNAKARRELGWEPSYSSWRQGFQAGFATPAGA